MDTVDAFSDELARLNHPPNVYIDVYRFLYE